MKPSSRPISEIGVEVSPSSGPRSSSDEGRISAVPIACVRVASVVVATSPLQAPANTTTHAAQSRPLVCAFNGPPLVPDGSAIRRHFALESVSLFSVASTEPLARDASVSLSNAALQRKNVSTVIRLQIRARQRRARDVNVARAHDEQHRRAGSGLAPLRVKSLGVRAPACNSAFAALGSAAIGPGLALLGIWGATQDRFARAKPTP